MEFKILLLLIKNPGRVFSADEIYERVWNERAVNTETVMVHVRNIREKIEINPKEPKYLKVVWGVGYKIEKNNHNLAVLIIALVILLPSLAMMFIRPHYISRQKEDGQISYSNTDLMDQLVKDTYVLYAEEYQREHGSDVTPFEIFFQRDTSVEENTPEEDTSDKEASGDSASDSASPENSKTQDPASGENASDDPSSAGSADDPSEEPASSEESSEETYGR